MIRINLLPTKQRKKRGAGQQQLLLFVIILVALGLLLYSIHSGEQEKVAILQQKEAEISKEMKRLEELIGDINTIQEKKTSLKKKLDVIELLRKGKTGPVRILDELSTVIPKKVWLESLNQSGNTLNMNGMATDNKEIAIFMKNLEASPFFSDIKLVNITQGKTKDVSMPVMSFRLHLKYSVPRS